MDLEDLLKDAKDIPLYKFERKLNKLVRDNYRYKNLSKDNREIIMDFVKKYKDRIRHQGGVSAYAIRKEARRLYQKRNELDLSRNDLDDIKDIMNNFKK